MDDILPPDIAALEARLQADPDSQELREELLPRIPRRSRPCMAIRGGSSTSCGITVRHRPRLRHLSLSPRRGGPEGIARGFRASWSSKMADANARRPRDDPDIARAAAKFLAISDRGRATELLLQDHDDPPRLRRRMDGARAYQRGCRHARAVFRGGGTAGCDQPNLQVWLARAAVDADDWTTVEAASKRLLDAAERARVEYGVDKLDWSENGLSMWARACAATSDSAQATALVRAIGAHAYHKHWGHTTAGHLALHQGDVEGALAHLKESAAVVGEPRLSSYGPSSLAGAGALHQGTVGCGGCLPAGLLRLLE